MKKHWLFIVYFGLSVYAYGDEYVVDSVRLQVNSNDTFYLARMQDIWVYPQMVFTSKKKKRF